MAEPTKKEIMDFSPMNTGSPEELPAYRRRAFGDLENLLKTRQIVAITGLRRVGKTTIIKQLAEKDAMFFSFDEKKYMNPEALKRVIEVFLEEREHPVIILDEVFRVEDWSGIIKRFHDQKKTRFIVSGSSALKIKKGIESLGGRMMEYYLPPLGFDEFLEMNGKSPETSTLKDIFKTKKRFMEDVPEFMKKGSFPEAIKMDDAIAMQYIKTSTIEKIIFDDIPSIFKIEHPSKLYDLFRLCSTNSSRLYTEVNLGEALGMSRHAVSDYLLYLNKAYLADTIFPKGSLQKAFKKQKKIFVKTASIYNATADNPNSGQSAETAVYDKISAQSPMFYRDPQKREVDFITSYPIEVKYQSVITNDDTHNLLYYMRERKKDFGMVVTKDLFDEKEIDGKRIMFIPLDVFLLADLKALPSRGTS